MADVKVVYWDMGGPENTDATLDIAEKRANELGINTIIVASTKGNVGLKAAQCFKGKRVIVVRHVTGFEKPNENQMPEELRKQIEAAGATVLTAAHVLGGFGRAVRLKYNTVQPDELVAQSLRILGAGVKVGVECAAMAADAGLVRTDQEVITIAGTSSGADTAMVVQPSNAHTFFDTRIREILCKPRAWK